MEEIGNFLYWFYASIGLILFVCGPKYLERDHNDLLKYAADMKKKYTYHITD